MVNFLLPGASNMIDESHIPAFATKTLHLIVECLLRPNHDIVKFFLLRF